MDISKPTYVKGNDILIKLDENHEIKALLAEGVSPKEAKVALLASLKIVCDSQGEDWRGVLFMLGLNAYAKDLDKESGK